MVWLNTEDAPHEWEFAVMVISEDTRRPLEARWRIVKQGEPMPTYMTLPPLDASSRHRRVTIKVTSSQLTLNECHRLDLAVSGSFVDLPGVDKRYLFDATESGRTEDIALATWWLLEGKGSTQPFPEDAARILTSCNALVYTPTSSASSSGATLPGQP